MKNRIAILKDNSHKKIILSFVAVLFLTFCYATANAIIPHKYSAIVVDFKTGKILYKKNENDRRYPASLTKIMTLYMVFEALDKGSLHLNQPLRVSHKATRKEPSKLGLKAGSYITVENAILSLVTKSANDMATVLAEAVGGSEDNFCKMMTERAKSLGMKNTAFYNPSGLPHPKQRTTAYDMAKLSMSLLKHYPNYYQYFNTRHFQYNGRHHRNHNRLLSKYRGLDGIKTGYIRDSGFNLVASAKRKGKRIVAVVMGGKTALSRDQHMMRLLDSTFYQLGISD